MSKIHRQGQGLSEYGLIGCLVALLCLGGLVALGDSLKSFIPAMMAAISSNRGGTKTASLVSSGNPASTAAQSIISSSSAAGISSPSSGLPLTPLSSLVDTIGVDGATGYYSDQLATLAKKLLADGEITQSQANMVIALSNQGHRMAGIEQLLEQAASQAKTVGEYQRMQISFEGKTYTPKELSALLGTDSSTAPNDFPDLLKISPSIANPELASFLNLYQQVQQSGILSNPDVAQQVSQLSREISYLGNVAMNTTWGTASNSNDPASSLKSYVSSLIQNAPAAVSGTTHQDSAGICVAGSGSDTGKKCAAQ